MSMDNITKKPKDNANLILGGMGRMQNIFTKKRQVAYYKVAWLFFRELGEMPCYNSKG
jgi:hypothetical protein